jgi:hypothetical protein
VRRDQNWKFAYDWTMSATRILHWQTSYDRFVENFPDDSSGGEFTYDKLGIKNIPEVPTFPNKRAPRVQVSGFNDIFGNQYLNQSSRQQLNFQISSPSSGPPLAQVRDGMGEADAAQQTGGLLVRPVQLTLPGGHWPTARMACRIQRRHLLSAR